MQRQYLRDEDNPASRRNAGSSEGIIDSSPPPPPLPPLHSRGKQKQTPSMPFKKVPKVKRQRSPSPAPAPGDSYCDLDPVSLWGDESDAQTSREEDKVTTLYNINSVCYIHIVCLCVVIVCVKM